MRMGKRVTSGTAIGGWMIHEAMQNINSSDRLGRVTIRNVSSTYLIISNITLPKQHPGPSG